MGLLGRTLFREISSNAIFGTALFTFVLFLQQVSKLFILLVRSSAPPKTVGYLFLLILPYVFTFTIPVGVLVGVLIALSRMSSDTEITAMRAAGIPSRRVIYPVLLYAFIGMIATAACTTYLNPWAIRQQYKIRNKLGAEELTADIQPRVFTEDFPNRILYVQDVVSGTVVRWRSVFIADITPPDQRPAGNEDAGDDPPITVASMAIAVPDVKNNRIQLQLSDGYTYKTDKDPLRYKRTAFVLGDQVLEAEKRNEVKPRVPVTEMDTRPLYAETRDSIDARIEFHRRMSLPPACILLALIGIPLGVSSRKGGKSSAFVLTVAISFLYWMGSISMVGLADKHTLPAWFALWLPNMVIGVVGLVLFLRLERPGDRDLVGAVQGYFREAWARLTGGLDRTRDSGTSGEPKRRFLLMPQLIDSYVLRHFLFYFGLLLASFVVMAQVYSFFELLSDVVTHHIAMTTVAKYLFFLTPMLVYDSTPMSVLVAVLVTFSILSKNNEVTALKACGVSLYRLALPVLLSGLVLSVSLLGFDHHLIPESNVIQDRLRNEIKGRPVQTYLRPDRKWIKGANNEIWYYRYFDQATYVMVGVYVFELDPETFRLRKHISAERARWEPSLKTWIFQNGWSREFVNNKEVKYEPFLGGTATFAKLKEPPNWFLREDVQETQMNFQQLADYIRELKQSGFDTVHLQVQFHKKFAVPLFALIMALLSVPFSFSSGKRGAMASIGVSFGIAVAYWSVSKLFEQIGNINQLPAPVAAWSPDAVFSLAGLYFMTRMKT